MVMAANRDQEAKSLSLIEFFFFNFNFYIISLIRWIS